MKEFSIIVPVKNEANNLPSLVKRIDSAMNNAGLSYEVIIVIDTSTDNTEKEAEILTEKYPVIVKKKQGRTGKGYSILEGIESARADNIAMIDGDLQYPPEALPEMFELLKGSCGVVVANRKKYNSGLMRRIGSRLNSYISGKMLLGRHYDTQSGLKVFRKDICEYINKEEISPWTFDATLLYTALELGYSIGQTDITFNGRNYGESKVNFLLTGLEIIRGNLKLRLAPKKAYYLKPKDANSMLGAGIIHKRKRFITHTTLPSHKLALSTVTFWQKSSIVLIMLLSILGLYANLLLTVQLLVAVLSIIYFLDVIFNTFIVYKSLNFSPEITISDEEVNNLNNDDLPIYSILCPLYKESRILPQFVDSIGKLSWPKEKLEVLLLLEEDDHKTIETAYNLHLPEGFRIVIIPHSEPKTKPKACNYGIAHAKGDFLVVYDAEDIPDPLQLKKSYIAFKKADSKVICLQAKLNYYNPHHNLLTKLFTTEYSLWFDMILPGLQSIESTIPLGGTSNHFRKSDLIKLQGWDPFNVTEDCDLGVRLFKEGYKTAIIDSTTMEEANSNFKNWLRQRSRWIKGYIQTYFVHMRSPLAFARRHGGHALFFQLVVGGKTAFMLINPILWLATILYFTAYGVVGPTIESLYPSMIFYIAVISLVFGNFMYLYDYMIGCAKRGHWELIKYVFFIPIYWLMASMAANMAVFQLIFRPYYWEKTIHGFHLETKVPSENKLMRLRMKVRALRIQQIADWGGIGLISGSFLVFANILGNFLNFLYNAYLSRTVSLEVFGMISLFTSFLYIAQVPFGAIGRTVVHRSAYLFGKYESPVKEFWSYNRKNIFHISQLITIFWIILTPFLHGIFQANEILPFLVFTPVWIIGALAAVDSGFLSGNLKFVLLGILTIIEAILKLGLTILLISLGANDWIYSAIPISMLVSFFIGWWGAKALKGKYIPINDRKQVLDFPVHFFSTSVLLQLSTIAFLGSDVMLAKIFLTPREAGQYALVSLVGKMVYFISTLFSQFLVPLISKAEGAGKKSSNIFQKLLSVTILSSLAGFIFFGLLGKFTAPILWGPKANDVIYFLPLYSLGIVLYVVSMCFVSFHQIRKEYLFTFVSLFLGLGQIIGIVLFHDSIGTIVTVIAFSAYCSLITIVSLHLSYVQASTLIRNVKDLIGLIGKLPESIPLQDGKLRILIFNWRDIKHKWAGGAEVYVHELAKRWVKTGNEVTLFCGNDQHCSRHEVIDGVNIIRRGGFYFVYIWAFLYYILRFRGKYDVILDSENGIPFFTPLYSRKKIFLLIHHVHQDVFRMNLRPPLSWIGAFLERRVMPIVYHSCQIITVSPSSKADISAYNLTSKEPSVIYNGVDLSRFKPGAKSFTPLVLYLGRLRFHKSLHIFIQAAKQIIKKMPEVEFIIAGDGQEKKMLQDLSRKLGLEEKIKFIGKVTEEEKIRLYQKAWVFVNPSLMEGWGITVIEANACGTPVVASNVPGLRDAIKNPHSGVLVPYGDVNEFSKTIESIIVDENMRKDMEKDAIEWANNFTWDKSAKESIKLFTGL